MTDTLTTLRAAKEIAQNVCGDYMLDGNDLEVLKASHLTLIAAMEAAEKYVRPYQWLLKQKASPSTTPYGECTLTFDVLGESRHAWGRAVEAGKGMTACIEAAIAELKETK